MKTEEKDTLKFKDEIVIPKVNVDLYISLYEIENWFKRICYIAYVFKYGQNWIRAFPPEFINKFKNRYNAIKNLLYLDAQLDDNLIWMSTLGELSQLILHESVIPFVETLTGLSKENLKNKIDEIRNIRNLLAHNRALSETTATIFQGITASFRIAIDNFKNYFIYEIGKILFDNENNDPINLYFQKRIKENDWSKFQAFIAKSEYFYSLVCLPVAPFGRFVSISKLFNEYKNEMDKILAFLINKEGDEYSILIPYNIEKELIINIIEIFLKKSDVWTKTPYIKQHPKYICDPKVWFYENRRDKNDVEFL
ncbi:MAG: hypothetical protein ACPLKS_08075 [Caldisericum exile]|uniref:hypothetical protein n=1 Tax=Caldisericum exile TaxID=693075 RepID=UPI003C717259